MNRARVLLPLLLVAVLAIPIGVRTATSAPPAETPEVRNGPMAEPADWMNNQRAFPEDTVAFGAFTAAADDAAALEARTADVAPAVAEASWELQGPTNVGGRIVDIVVDVDETGTVYAASASGGLWRTTDDNQTYEPIWPDDLTQALGAIAQQPDGTLFAGTGEAQPGGGSLTFGGTGMYRSEDRGETWELVGLEESGAFAEIVVHPTEPETIYAAASGHLYIPGGQRGLYVSTDGGDSWEQLLEGRNGTTGATDIAIDPSDPDHMLVALWDHLRTPGVRTYGGFGSGIYETTDGGESWVRVDDSPQGTANDRGLPNAQFTLGRMAVAFAPSDPDRVYVTAINTDGRYRDFYRSENGGQTFTTPPESQLIEDTQSVFGWWFSKIFVDPADADHVFFPGVVLVESQDGGATADFDSDVHADQHALTWVPDTDIAYLGNDGGMYRSTANGAVDTYEISTYMPWTQHYTVDVGEQSPDRIVTGLQDQGSIRSYNDAGEIAPDIWENYNGGDGLETIINPENEEIVYGCSQYGNCRRSTDAGDSTQALGPRTSDSTRRNWLTPLELDPNDPSIVYYAGEIVERSTDGGLTFEPISPDLTRGIDQDLDYPFGTITTVGIATTDPNVLYVGTDDGRLWTTKNLGEDWIELTDPILPDIYVTRTTVDPTDEDVAYVTYSGFRQGDDRQLVFRTADGGATWQDISGDLPAAPVNDILIAGDDLVVAQDVGVYASGDLGETWLRVGDDLPLAPILDIRHHEPTGTVTAATFGRGIYRTALPDIPDVEPPPPGPEPEPEPEPATPPGDGGPDDGGPDDGDPDDGGPDDGGPDDGGPDDGGPGGPDDGGTPPDGPDDGGTPPDVDRVVDRIAGLERVETAARISEASFAPGVDVAFVATAGAFPDSLSGSAAAGTLGGPVLLVTDEVPGATAAELERLQPGRVVVLGGEVAVSEDVESALAPFTAGEVTRLAGQERIATSAAISAGTYGAGVDVAYVATASAFPDALTAAAAAGRDGAPVLLVGDEVGEVTAAELERLAPGRIAVLGGVEAVSAEVEGALGGYAPVERLGGANRFATAAAIAATFGAPTSIAYVATGIDFPDALTVAPAAALTDSPVLLVAFDQIPPEIAVAYDRLDPDRTVVVGGDAAVAPSVLAALDD